MITAKQAACGTFIKTGFESYDAFFHRIHTAEFRVFGYSYPGLYFDAITRMDWEAGNL